MGFIIEGEAYNDDTPEKEDFTIKERFKQFICWIMSGHDYMIKDIMMIEGRKYYFRTCRKCFQNDEAYI